MNNDQPKPNRLKPHFNRALRIVKRFTAILFTVLACWNFSAAQQDPPTADAARPGGFRIGERLTYNVSLENFKNAAFAETHVVSYGKLDGRDAVELRMRIKTSGFIGAAFFSVDTSHTTFAAAETGLPLYIRRTSYETGLPKSSVENYLSAPTVNYDLLTMIYRARRLGGAGDFSVFENDRLYNVSLQTAVSEQVRTSAGDFDTSVSNMTSEYLTEKGISKFRVNFSQEESRIPVLIRFETEKGEFRAELASVRVFEGSVSAVPTPTPTPTPAPTPVPTPKPVPTPEPFQENQPLSPDLPFRLGETLEFAVTNAGQPFATVNLQASQRVQFRGEDSLLLAAGIGGIAAGNTDLNLGDRIIARVNPDSLAPQMIELFFGGSLNGYNQIVEFDQRSGTASFNGNVFPDIPVGTHSVLSLAYAIRSFNLKPSKDLANPVNDTRVAVFLNGNAYVFTLRPKDPGIIDLQGRKLTAQEISVTTGISAVDALGLRLWLSVDEKRTPLRITAGPYQADLISEQIILPSKMQSVP